MPKAPPGHACCRVWDRRSESQISHLTIRTDRGTPGPTLCGLTRFDDRDPETYAVIRKADLPGWDMDGGTYGPGVLQTKCEPCWARAEEGP